MADFGSPNYKIGLIIANAQPLHNGHIKIMAEALMDCDEIIVSFKDYDTSYFDYNINQKLGRNIFGNNKRISYFGTTTDSTLGTPKHFIEHTLNSLSEANYYMPTHFFTSYDAWVEPAKELQLETKLISNLPNTKSVEILQSLNDSTDFWKSKVPYSSIELIESYIATKNRNF